MMYIKNDPNDRETHWSTSYHDICMSGAPQPPFQLLKKAPGGPKKLGFYQI